MLAFAINVARALKAVLRGLRDPEFRHLFVGLILLLISGAAFYSAVEGWGILDATYFCVMTLSTVGYGDLHPTTPLSKIFTMLYLFVGAGIFVGLVTKIAAQRRDLPGIRRRRHENDTG